MLHNLFASLKVFYSRILLVVVVATSCVFVDIYLYWPCNFTTSRNSLVPEGSAII